MDQESNAETATSATEPRFTGLQLTRTATGINRDILAVVLTPDKQYTESDAKKLINKFMKKEVVSDGRR
jgi:hypothetical protein